ncbi:multidrug ABC transporter substrate-binding protein [Paenibacillus jamilae]|uniref:Multidrug ABC transporter substrate-binding protein n=1 Tax=Paenibacillus jamilae TaxID=114136 RepID=A0ACC4ZNN8_9BACL|nr:MULTISPECIES: ABC transporter permease [Paenibacillus]AJE49717.1 multidrug ABC transporter substrate-binding protein [Paenibacillus polymyxa]AUO08965.1 multidrug ABC transporter substrate-binding protein [Paenibacillus sp. lzh-N1]KTS75587.1 multidrug ABC transporter substrate-binding protein [Paenibacillus jamilae]QOH61909.1 multidrug ABC transporter substrate-binding protein [Paenibacillus polymyxa]
MKFQEIIRVSLNSLRTNMLRSLLTMVGIIIGVAAVIAIVAIGKGSTATITSQINSMGNNLLMIYPYAPYDGSSSMSFNQTKGISLEDIEALEQQKAVAEVAPSAMTNADITWSRNKVSGQIEGTSLGFVHVRKLSLAQGRSFTHYEVDKRLNVAVLGSDAARNIFGPDASKAVGEIIMIKQLPFKVVGVLANSNSNMNNSGQQVYVPITTGMERLGNMSIQQVNASATTEEKIDQASAQIRQVLRVRHELKPSEGDDFQIMTQTEILKTVSGVDRVMNMLLIGVAAIALGVGGVGIMNIMLVSVTERTREIGIRKAIGAQRSDIMLQFVAEAVFLSLMGGLVGVMVGLGGAKLLEKFVQMPIVYSIEPVLYSFLCCMGVGVLFGVYPARKASKLRPIDALRYE